MSADKVLEVLGEARDVAVHCGNSTWKKLRRLGKNIQMVTVGFTRYPGWQEKALHRWTTAELIDFCIQNRRDFHIGMKFISRLVPSCELWP